METKEIIEKYVLVSDIVWDTDGEDVDLPEQVKFVLDIDQEVTDEDIEELVPDILSDENGFLVESYSYEICVIEK